MPNKDGFFLAGSRVRVRLPVGKPFPACSCPRRAILSDQDKRYVLIADDKNHRPSGATSRSAMLTDDGMRAIQPADKLAEGEKPRTGG